MEYMTVKNSAVFYSFKSKTVKHLSLLLILSALTACGGSDSGSENNLTQPTNVSAIAGNMQVTLSWDNVIDATGYDICRATETITQPTNCSVHQNGALAVDQSSPAIISSLINDTEYFFVVTPKNANGDGAASAVVSATPSATGKLNDTGITLCADFAIGFGATPQNNLDCSLTTDADGDLIPPGQDAVSGRDANLATNNDNDGHKGFSFTKIGSNGFALTDQSSTTFSCVKDNVTDLIWEVKQTTAGLHNKDDVYTWLNTLTPANNGGNSGTVNANASCESNTDNTCNTQAYVSRVNIASLCGATNWRLPTRKELRSLVSYDRSSPAIDAGYFPNTNASSYWSSSPYAPVSNNAWSVFLNVGFAFASDKSNGHHVRLVRSGQ